MDIERLEELKDLLIWMTGSSEIRFREDQAELFSDGLKLIDEEIERQKAQGEFMICENCKSIMDM